MAMGIKTGKSEELTPINHIIYHIDDIGQLGKVFRVYNKCDHKLVESQGRIMGQTGQSHSKPRGSQDAPSR